MRSRRQLTLVAVLIAGSAQIAHSQTWTVREYGTATPCGCYTADPIAKEITITSNPGRLLQFEVFFAGTSGEYLGPAPIDDFTIALGVTGSIEFEIARNGNGPFDGPGEPGIIISTNGASILRKMNVRFGNGQTDISILKKMKVGVLGDPDSTTNTVEIDLLDGPLQVGPNGQAEPPLADHGDLLNTVSIRGVLSSSGGGPTVNRDLRGTLVIEGAANRPIRIKGDMSGLLHIQDNLIDNMRIDGELNGTVTIDGDLGGSLDVGNQLSGTITAAQFSSSGTLSLADVAGSGAITLTNPGIGAGVGAMGSITIGEVGAGNMAGTLHVMGNWEEGLLDIVNDVTSTGQLLVDWHLRGGIGTTDPTWHIAGSMDGTITIGKNLRSSTSAGDDQPVIAIDTDLGGEIRINGSLKDGVGTHPEIVISGVMDSNAAVAVDYDGWHANDSWRSGAKVKVGSIFYGGNDDAQRLYEIRLCKGDMNNDDVVDTNDENGFALAKDNPDGVGGYAESYPGLRGSMLYHADMDCDGDIDADDEVIFDTYASGTGDCCLTADCETLRCPL